MDMASLQKAMKDIEVAYFIGAVHPDYSTWFDNFLRVAENSGVKRIVKFSGMTASVDAGSEVIRTHGITDQCLMDSGMDYTIIRPNSFYQNMLLHAPSIKDQGAFYLNMGDARQSQVDVRDIATVSVHVLTEPGHEGHIYEVTGPEPLTYHDVAEKLSAALNKKVAYVAISDEEANQGMQSAGQPQWMAHTLTELFRFFAAGNAEKVTTTVKEITGREPISFDRFASDFHETFI